MILEYSLVFSVINFSKSETNLFPSSFLPIAFAFIVIWSLQYVCQANLGYATTGAILLNKSYSSCVIPEYAANITSGLELLIAS